MTGVVILRQAVRIDIPAMSIVRYAVRENPLRPGVIDDEDVRREIEDTGRGWIVEADGRIVAFAIGNVETASIWALFVAPDAEHRGYGRRLHAEMVDWLWSRGLDSLWLETGRDTRARLLYERLGWKVVGDAHHNQVRMELYRSAPSSL